MIFRVHISVYPLGSSEPSRVLLAVRSAWVNPSWQQSREVGGAWFVEGSAEAALPNDEEPEAFALRMTRAVWRNVGRFVKVVIDMVPHDGGEHLRFEWAQSDHARWLSSNRSC